MDRPTHPLNRRRALTLLGGLILAPGIRAQSTMPSPSPAGFAPVVPGYAMRFPFDEGSHPEFRIEWWYVTGWLESDARHDSGFQITFFRARPDPKHANPSAFAPHQIFVAHAALADPSLGRLVQGERAARAAFGLAGAERGRTRVWIDDWSLEHKDGVYRARISAPEFRFALDFVPTQKPLLQGDGGYSRKGPAAHSASYYYSLPHLEVQGILTRGARARRVNGQAWLDHEWSSSYMDADAVGWDWIGINLDDGSALMAFRMRDSRGGALWAGGSLRNADGRVRTFPPEDIRFLPGRRWQSARSRATYPVSWTVIVATLELEIEPMMDDQEHDTRRTTGTIYWEGAIRAFAAGKAVGRGYLELTGYWRPFRF